jgi:hypothetical protein
VDGSGTPTADGQPDGPSAAQVAAASAARQAMAYRLLGAACALVGVLLVVGGLLALHGRSPAPPPAAAPTTHPAGSTATAAPPSTAPPSTAPPGTAPASTAPATTAAPAPSGSGRAGTAPPPTSHTTPVGGPTLGTVRAPLTVLNNTTRAHLAEQAADLFRAGGWQVVKIGNFTGSIPSTTVYFTPDSTTEERAAQALARQFTGIIRVLPRYAGLPSSVHGVIVVLAPDWSG